MSTDFDFIEKYNALRDTIVCMIRADKSIMGDDAYLPIPWSDDMTLGEEGDEITVRGAVWTNQFGGSNESIAFNISKTDIAIFVLRQLLAPVGDK